MPNDTPVNCQRCNCPFSVHGENFGACQLCGTWGCPAYRTSEPVNDTLDMPIPKDDYSTSEHYENMVQQRDAALAENRALQLKLDDLVRVVRSIATADDLTLETWANVIRGFLTYNYPADQPKEKS